MQEFVVLNFGCFMDYQNSFDNFLSGGSRDAPRKVSCKLVKLPRRSSKKLARKWAWLTPNNSAELTEHVDIRFNNV